jgi:hypothetical protein
MAESRFRIVLSSNCSRKKIPGQNQNQRDSSVENLQGLTSRHLHLHGADPIRAEIASRFIDYEWTELLVDSVTQTSG